MAGVSKVTFKVIGLVSGLVAAKGARAVLDKAWRAGRGTEPPRNPAVPGTEWSEAVTWAIASGIALGLAKMLAARGIAGVWRRATGSLPPGVEDTGA
jgi:hypothetical protein